MPLKWDIPLTPGDYEDGVAELLQQKLGDRANVDRTVQLNVQRSGRTRQIDVLVRFPVPGMDDVLMVVDTKLYRRPVDVTTVDQFIGLVEDVGAASGLLVTPHGFSGAARNRAAAERDIRVEVV